MKKKSAKKKVAKKAARKRGRPTAYRQAFCEQATKLCRLGAIDRDLSDFFGVTEKTLNLWKEKYPDFLQSIKKGKASVDDEVEKSLLKRAMGMTTVRTKTRVERTADGVKEIEETQEIQVPPDTGAAFIWLKNRRKENWRDKIDHDHSFPDNIEVTIGGNADEE